MNSGFGLSLAAVLTAFIACNTDAAPSVCRTCNVGCNNTIDDEFADFDTNSTNRTKRESSIEQRMCTRFQLEIIFIPLSIALIPLGLCALLLCACCCGPEESRGKMPESFLSKKKKADSKESSEIDDVDLVFKDGVVMRKDSKKTRFSLAISFIEARRFSIDILNNSRRPSSASVQQSTNDLDDDKAEKPSDLESFRKCDSSAQNERNENDMAKQFNEDRLPRRTSSKKTRFAESIDVLGEANA